MSIGSTPILCREFAKAAGCRRRVFDFKHSFFGTPDDEAESIFVNVIVVDGGTITVDSSVTDLGDVTRTSGTIAAGNTRPLDEANKATAKWEKPSDALVIFL